MLDDAERAATSEKPRGQSSRSDHSPEIDEPVSDVKGSYRTQAPATGALHWIGMFSPDSWFVSGEVAQFFNGAGDGSAVGGGQVVGFASFDTRSMGGQEDAAAE